MKTRLMIEIKTPNEMIVYNADGEVSKKEAKEFCKEWHRDLVNFIKNIHNRLHDDFIEEIDLYYNEGGELPSFVLNISEIEEV